MSDRMTAIYHVKGDGASIDERAHAIAVEQSVEMPISAIDDRRVRAEIVGKVAEITDLKRNSLFAVRIDLAVATTGLEAGQLLNMLFGNTSIHDDVQLYDVELPASMAESFGGPRLGLKAL